MKKNIKSLVAIGLITIMLGNTTCAYATSGVEGENKNSSTNDESKNLITEEMIEEVDEKKTQPNLELTAPSVVLMESSTGDIIYDANSDVQMPPASVTKVMTMLLIFEAIAAGQIKLEDEVVTSEYAASMGGSQVFLEVGEKQTVDTMLKCIAVSSANDACVAMAEYVGGSEEAFVQMMNNKAKELGMKNTTFINCNGLDAEGHLSTAYDIVLMSRELMDNHPEVQDYTMIWMENITHTTSKGTSEFGLSNTNKLVRYYEYTTGLKTGYTSEARFCISATAQKNDINLIAVIMGAPTSPDRNADAVKLFNYGFANCQKYTDNDKIDVETIPVLKGVEDKVTVEITKAFTYIDTSGADLKTIERKVITDEVVAPIVKGDILGEVEYYLSDKKIGSTVLTACEDVDELNFQNAIGIVGEIFIL